MSTRTILPHGTQTATPTAIPGYNNCGDVTGDGRVTVRDLSIETVALRVGMRGARYDISRDGQANGWDLLLIVRQLGTRCRR